MKHAETIILSLGGSLIVSNKGIDTQFLIDFNNFIRQQIASKKRRFFIICGGGATARHYIEAGKTIVGHTLTTDDMDWLGIHTTRLNAHLIRTVFRDIAYPRIFKHYDRDYDIKDEPVIVCSGWKPGWSTDYDGVLIAQKQHAKILINMSNIDKVYNKDPRKFSDAHAIEKINWNDFAKLVGTKWVPGLNAPFDPIATQLAREIGLKVMILNGKKLDNLEKAINGEKFIGTIIES
jgi:uridylate kinase